MQPHTADINVTLGQPSRRKMVVELSALIRKPGETPNAIKEHRLSLKSKIEGDFDPTTWPGDTIVEYLAQSHDFPIAKIVRLTVTAMPRLWHQRLLLRGPSRKSLNSLRQYLQIRISGNTPGL